MFIMQRQEKNHQPMIVKTLKQARKNINREAKSVVSVGTFLWYLKLKWIYFSFLITFWLNNIWRIFLPFNIWIAVFLLIKFRSKSMWYMFKWFSLPNRGNNRSKKLQSHNIISGNLLVQLDEVYFYQYRCTEKKKMYI